jgi:hypothetical protein
MREACLILYRPSLLYQLYWTDNISPGGFSIIVFPGEFKNNDEACNMNQLMMVLTTAQSQRKALALKNSVIMGATSCRGRVRIYSSYWGGEGDTVTSSSISVSNDVSFLHRSSISMSIWNNSISRILSRSYIFTSFV